ncbi:hypothetical protein BDF14DRAFT_116448 [Spinellus fusiger]|nr:hypothetical protein BDF14DRAFT_116448 [Spinellus fusiger]
MLRINKIASALIESEAIEGILSKQESEEGSEESWAATLSAMEARMSGLEATVKSLEEPNRIAWKKRHIKRLQEKRDQRQKTRERLLRKLEMWRMSHSYQGTLEKNKLEKAKEKRREKDEKRTKIKDMSRLVSKITLLRNLRRQKLQNKGHFFPEEGNEFFNKIKAWNEAEEERDSTEQGVSLKEGQMKIHPQDQWQTQDLDLTAYRYWSHAYQSTDGLRHVRRLWDQWTTENAGREAKVPPFWIEPSPPANWVWASCLVQDSCVSIEYG